MEALDKAQTVQAVACLLFGASFLAAGGHLGRVLPCGGAPLGGPLLGGCGGGGATNAAKKRVSLYITYLFLGGGGGALDSALGLDRDGSLLLGDGRALFGELVAGLNLDQVAVVDALLDGLDEGGLVDISAVLELELLGDSLNRRAGAASQFLYDLGDHDGISGLGRDGLLCGRHGEDDFFCFFCERVGASEGGAVLDRAEAGSGGATARRTGTASGQE
ncbi:hypothetical protein FGB62_65g06 [Gracilaria domingensis]|nr:hypothetical protein FGB62_65g06 [Gracilaria domingensis]